MSEDRIGIQLQRLPLLLLPTLRLGRRRKQKGRCRLVKLKVLKLVLFSVGLFVSMSI